MAIPKVLIDEAFIAHYSSVGSDLAWDLQFGLGDRKNITAIDLSSVHNNSIYMKEYFLSFVWVTELTLYGEEKKVKLYMLLKYMVVNLVKLINRLLK